MSHDEFRPSSFLARKGVAIEATFQSFRQWDLNATLTENVKRIRQTNPIGAPSNAWLRDFGKILLRRYDTAGPDRPLVELVQRGWDLDTWRPVLLWHVSRTDPLLNDFLSGWIFDLKRQGIVLIKHEAGRHYLRSYLKRHLSEHRPMWSDSNIAASASGLLHMAVQFHLLRGRQVKEFESYRLPDESFIYLLRVFMERLQNTRRVVQAKDWRLFMLQPREVEEELLRLHQFGKVRFERAGSLMELTLPSSTVADHAGSVAG